MYVYIYIYIYIAFDPGKSTLLYFLAHFCRSLDWIVVYIPHCAKWVRGSMEDAEDAARCILDVLLSKNGDKLKTLFFRGHSLFSICEGNHFDTLDSFRRVLQTLKTQRQHAVFIAIDQWNALFAHEIAESHPLYLFRNFSSMVRFFCAFIFISLYFLFMYV